MTDWRFKMEPPTTEEVREFYHDWLDPNYLNPEAQKAWDDNNRAEFEAWLAEIRAEAWQEGNASLDVGQPNPYRKDA